MAVAKVFCFQMICNCLIGMAGTTGLEPATSDVTVKSLQPRFLFVYLTLAVFHGSNHGSNSATNCDDSTGVWTHDSARISSCGIIALGVWMPWKHIFNVPLLHFTFKSEVRSFLKLPIGASKIPATGAQGALTFRPGLAGSTSTRGAKGGRRAPKVRHGDYTAKCCHGPGGQEHPGVLRLGFAKVPKPVMG